MIYLYCDIVQKIIYNDIEMPRVITGKAKGARLENPPDARPMTDRAKSALFAMLADDIKGKRILDLYAGSGSLGIEALSRGAKSCVFVDEARSASGIIKKNLARTNLSTNAQVIQKKASQFLSVQEENSFDIVFMDPPYEFYSIGNKKLAKFILRVLAVVPDGGALILKHPPLIDIPEVENTKTADTRKYGKNSITILVQMGNSRPPKK